MKKIFIVLTTLVVLIFFTLVAIPIIFKDDIYAEIEKVIDKNINADIQLDKKEIDISLITTFPNLSLSIKNIHVFNRKPFDEKLLFKADKFEINVNLLSAIYGKFEIKSVDLVHPKINIYVDEKGNANYNIVVGDKEASKSDSKENNNSDFTIKVEHWSIEDGNISYIDKTNKIKAVFQKFNHSGSGDFGLSIFDMITNTTIEKTFVSLEDQEFLEGKSLTVKSTIGMDLKKMKFSFKESTLSINKFILSMAGIVEMSKSSNKNTPISVDIRLATPSQGIKPLLSLIPTVFKSENTDMVTNGNMSMTCLLKGIVSENEMPSIELNMKIDDGEIGYQSLTEKIQELGVDLHIEMKKMLPQYAKIDLKKFNVKIGKNPISGKVYIENLNKPYINATLNGHVDFATLNKTIPMDSLTVKGLLDLKLKILGNYDTLARKMPQIKLDYDFKNGYVKYDTLDIAIENIIVKGNVSNDTGMMKDTKIKAHDLSFIIEDEKFNASFELWNMDNYHWDYKAKGNLNLNKVQKALPFKDTVLKGDLFVDVLGKGDLKSLKNKTYHKIINKGNTSITGFYYNSTDLPQSISMDIKLDMDQKGINLRSVSGALGKSPFVASGWIRDYLPYLLSDEGIIKGKMKFSSKNFNVTEWLVESDSDGDASKDNEDNERVEVFVVPKQMEFEFDTSIQTLNYDNMILTNMDGLVKVMNGKIVMEHLKFNAFQGSLDMNGEYNTIVPKKPTFNMKFDAKNLKVKEAYDNLSIINKMVPIAESIDGYFSTNFKMNGDILEDMTPNLETLYGQGIVELKQISIDKSSPIVNILNEQLKFLGKKSLTMKNIKTETKIENGTIETKPFDVGFSGQNARVYGKTKLSGHIDYTIDFNLDQNALSSMSSIGTHLPNNLLANQKIILPVKVGGTYSKPNCKLGTPRLGKGASKAIREEVKKKANAKLKELGVTNKDSLNKILNSKDPAKEIEKKAKQLKNMLGF